MRDNSSTNQTLGHHNQTTTNKRAVYLLLIMSQTIHLNLNLFRLLLLKKMRYMVDAQKFDKMDMVGPNSQTSQ